MASQRWPCSGAPRGPSETRTDPSRRPGAGRCGRGPRTAAGAGIGSAAAPVRALSCCGDLRRRVGEISCERERKRERKRERQRETQRDTERETERETKRQEDRETERRESPCQPQASFALAQVRAGPALSLSFQPSQASAPGRPSQVPEVARTNADLIRGLRIRGRDGQTGSS